MAKSYSSYEFELIRTGFNVRKLRLYAYYPNPDTVYVSITDMRPFAESVHEFIIECSFLIDVIFRIESGQKTFKLNHANIEVMAELDNTIKECLIISLKTSEDFKLICLNYEEIRKIQNQLIEIVDNSEKLIQSLSTDSEDSEEESIVYDVCGNN